MDYKAFADADFYLHQNPFHESAEKATLAWAERMSLFRNAHSRDWLGSAKITLFTALSYPNAGMDDLILCNNWMTWLFVVDDQFAERDYATNRSAWDTAIRHVQQTLDFHTGRRCDPPAGSQSSGLRAFDELCERTFPRMSAALGRRFARDLLAEVAANSEEVDLKFAGTVPSVAECIRLRRADGGTEPLCDLLELTEHTEVPEALMPQYQELRYCLADFTLWSNDIISLPKEEANHEVINLVLSVQERDSCSRDEAIETVRLMTGNRARQLVSAEREFYHLLREHSLPAKDRQAIWRCVRGIHTWASACVSWYFLSPRYSDNDKVEAGSVSTYAENIFLPATDVRADSRTNRRGRKRDVESGVKRSTDSNPARPRNERL